MMRRGNFSLSGSERKRKSGLKVVESCKREVVQWKEKSSQVFERGACKRDEKGRDVEAKQRKGSYGEGVQDRDGSEEAVRGKSVQICERENRTLSKEARKREKERE